jgi:cytochrome c oxidase cbb3-type subunit 2
MSEAPHAEIHEGGGVMQNLTTFSLVCGAIFLVYALGMAIIPGAVLSRTRPTPGAVALTAQEQRGRDVYIGEGCSYCHTQQVRPLAQDRVWGRPSIPGDFAYATPEFLGTERTGPDLTNVGARQNDLWNEIHLYQPRSLVAQSIMPSYKWLFATKAKADAGDTVVPVPAAFVPAGEVVIATPDMLALVAYLHQLKQPPLGKETP